MKTQIKRISKSSLAVVLTLCLLFSCLTVGIVATDAAKINSESTGANFVSGSKIYLCTNNCSWWTNDSDNDQYAKFGSGTNTKMTKERAGIYSITVPSGTFSSVTFQRGSWNTVTVNNYPGNTKNTFYVTGEGTNTGSWGYCPTTVKDQYIYFDNTNGFLNHTNKYFVIGHDSFYRIHKLTNISGTNLYYCNNTSDWGDSLYVGVFSENDDWQSGTNPKDVNNKNWENDVVANADGYKALYSGAYEFNDGNSVLLTTSAASNSATLTPTYLSANTALNSNLTIKTALKSGSTYAETSTKLGTFSATNAKRINGNGSSASSSISQTNGTATLETARTNTAKVSQSAVSGYTFKGWKAGSLDTSGSSLTTGTYSFTNAGSAATVYAYYEPAATNYTGITAVAKGTTDGTNYSVDLGSIKSSTTVSSSTGLAVSAPAKTGYTFSKWVASGSGTFGSTTSASTTFHPSKNSEVATAQYKKSYTITKNTPTGGSVTLSNTSRVAGQTYTVTLTPNDGYKVKSLTLNGSAVTVSNNKYPGTASGTSDTLAFVATFEPDTSLQLYIAGRFRVRPSSGSSSWTTTYASGSDWNATSTNIQFTYLSGTTYKVDTYASLAELSAKPTNNQDPWFFVYDKTNGKAWHPTTQNRELGTTTEYNLTTNTGTYNVRFNSSSTDSPVTIYFDYNTKRLWYSVPDLYDVTVENVTGGSVTASPSRAEAGAEITLTVTPTNGYKLKSLTAKDSNNATVTITNNKFTMPAKNVTVTPVFEKITWGGLTAVGKYSTTAENDASYSNDFPAGSAPNVTIDATSATQVDGVKVTAPANDPKGYVFAGWYSAKGGFDNAENKDTTFKPNAENAVAIAKYKKIFTITSSVDNTGTGAGTVTTSKTSVEAGGSYDITATAKPGSAIESVKVNGTAKTATASQTISSVSADQTVVVKFAAKPHVIGGLAAAGWTQPGDAMKSNDAGTEFTFTRTELAAGTYDFQHYIGTGTGGTYDNSSTDIATKTISGGATLSSVDNGYNTGNKFRLVLTAKSDVTLVSDGSKFTAITVRRSGGTKYDVTFKKADNTTITGSYEGTNFTTAENDVTVKVYSGDEISFTVTAASGYHISALTSGTTPAFSPAVTEYKLSNVTEDKTITPTAAADVNVTAKTNKSARGTVTVNKTKSFKGDTVKITVTPLAGSLKSLTATYAGGGTYEYKNDNWTIVTTSNGASSNKISGSTGAAIKSASTGAAQTIDMVMKEDSAVTINATFDAYSGESNYYYNGYQSATDPKSAYWGKQMTESMLSGEKFSYYHVTGRGSENYDQFFTVSDGKVDTGTRYVYFTQLKSGGWDYSHSPHAYFMGASNSWPGGEMTWYTDNDMGQPVYRIAIPSGATGVVFNDNGTHKSTDINDLASGGYYVDEYSTYDGSSSVHEGHTYSCSYPNAGSSGSGNEYKWGSGVYKDNFYSGGFYNQGSNVAKPKDNNGTKFSACKDDYYIVVLYPGKTYTINYNGHETTNTVDTDKPWVIWMSDLPTDDETVTVYAKDGAIRAETFGATYANIADTKIYLNNTVVGTDHSGNITNQTYQTYKAAKGDTLVIKTQIGATDSSDTGVTGYAALRAKYYVRGFCVNGEVTQLLEWNTNGLYTLTYKVPEDYEGKNIEITPIYYLKDTTANPIVTYRVTGFTDELKAIGSGKPGWGDTLYTYPYYGKLGGDSNAFGAYPGQPMVYYKGQYQMQIPQKSTTWVNNTSSNTTVSGVTMSNGYWDSVHKSIMGYGDNSKSADHVQTYDYGDFYKIFNEKQPVDNIVFDFKYRTTTHNLVTSIDSPTPNNLTSTYKNGFELLTNFHGRNVDLFGTPLSGDAADPSKTKPLYVVSIGGVKDNVSGVENIAGYYATEWKVFAPNTTTGTPASSDAYTLKSANGKSSIPPEVLVLNNNTTSFNNTTYPSADASHNVTDWQALYTALEAYRNMPVMISYEAADAQQGQGMYYTGTGGATRNDGRWLYSKNGENITSNIKIQYSDDNGVTYTDLNTTTPQVSGLSAYFTNDGVEGQMTYSTTIDPDKTFDFEAKTTNGSYKFVGWYMEDGTKITSDNASHTERSGSYTFVAKFMQVQSGQLILSHSADKGTIGGTKYQGAGTAKIKVVVKDGDEVIRTYDMSTSDVTLDDKIIKSDSSYTIEVTLEATATGNDDLGTTVLANPSGQDATYFTAASTTTVDKTKTIVLKSFTVASLFDGTTQNVKNIIYHSYFTQSTFFYDILFQYTDRFGATKKLYKQGYLTAAQAANPNYVAVRDVGSERNARNLMPAFLQTIAPHVSNFGETIKWNFVEEGYTFGVQDYAYTLTNVVLSAQTKNDKRDVTFVLPYEHTDGIARLNNGVGTAATPTNFKLIGENAVTYNTVPVLLNNGVNGIYSSEDKKHWIAAPAVINDNDTGEQKFFQYWKIAATTNPDVEVARCYFNGFNYVAYDNYIITAVYDPVNRSNANSDVFTGATYLETSRNQWNTKANSEKSDKDTSGNRIAADLLYNDFVLNYNYKGVDIYKGASDSEKVQDLGIVVERIDELDIKQDGTKDTNVSKYVNKYKDGLEANESIIKAVINGSNTEKKFTKHAIEKTSLDNKNRIEVYDAIYNGAGWSLEKQASATKYGYKNYVYRVYSYMKYIDDNGQEQIALAQVPAYFTMYDEAVAGYKAPTSTNP